MPGPGGRVGYQGAVPGSVWGYGSALSIGCGGSYMVSAFVKTQRTVTTKGESYCVNYSLIFKGGWGGN